MFSQLSPFTEKGNVSFSSWHVSYSVGSEKQTDMVPLVTSREHLAEHHGVVLYALLTNWQKQRDGGVRAKPSRG